MRDGKQFHEVSDAGSGEQYLWYITNAYSVKFISEDQTQLNLGINEEKTGYIDMNVQQNWYKRR